MQNTQSFIQNTSGIELHLHAEGSIPKDFLWMKRTDFDKNLTREQFDAEFNYSNFKDFVKHWCQNQKLLFSNPNNYNNIEQCNDLKVHPGPIEILPVVAESLTNQGIAYAELHVSPIDGCFMSYGKDLISYPDFYIGIVKAWQLACKSWNQSFSERLTIKLILDLVRNYPKDIQDFQVNCIRSIKEELTEYVAIGLGGGNDSKSLLDFKSNFIKIREMGFGLVAHAGEHLPVEVASAEIGAALELGVDRIGHGIHGFQKHIAKIIDENVVLEVCPTSNLMTGSVSNMTKHPLKELCASNVKFVVGSDDPVYFGTNFWREIDIVSKVCSGSSNHDQNKFIRSLLLAAVDASFADNSLKSSLRKKICME
ncbi:MAG: hypothetical protein VX619_00460 [bacterium]|nr:hypothetical protein [bacterium]